MFIFEKNSNTNTSGHVSGRRLLPYLRIFPLILWAAIAIQCNEAPTPKKKTYLLSAKKKNEKTSNDIQAAVSLAADRIPYTLPFKVAFDVETYTITYTTTYQGNPITASGTVLLPLTDRSLSLISIQHATLTKNSKVPSENANSFPLFSDVSGVQEGTIISSFGFIVALPDYIGFGSSVDILHPYVIEDPTATAVVDMLKAVRELATDKKKKFNEKVMLFGHSEGGYATMATHKYMEENKPDGLTLIASFPSAGAYDVKKIQEYLFSQDTYDSPVFLAYVAYSYSSTLKLNTPLTHVFNAPYASRIPKLFDGTKDLSSINGQLTVNMNELLVPDMKKNINTNPKYSELVNALNDNSLTNWTPTIRMEMYHGKDDTVVPYSTSQSTYDALIKNGASPKIVTLNPQEGGHEYYLDKYMPLVLNKIKELENQ